ncbi:MAG: glycosyltransferase [Candidatus Binatia bacterium]|nr:glycosyltransferase [Candidatus Binatia bacterium]
MIDPASPDYANTPVSAQRPRFDYLPADPTASPCVTIVTPFYNTGPVFHDTARSVLQQSLQQWEWIIVNDGSTDPVAVAVLDSYRHRDPRIRVIDLGTNCGPSAARNRGFQEARAPYVAQLDSDNLLEPTAIEKWLWFLESYPEFAFVKGYSVGFGAQEYLWQKGFQDASAFLEYNVVDVTSLIRKTVHATVGGYDETIREGLEDWDFWLRCAAHGFWGATLPEYLDWYRRRTTHTDRWATWDNADRQRAFHARLRQRYPGLWKGGFPRIAVRPQHPLETVPHDVPWENRLAKQQRRLLLLVPWLACGGADKFNLDVLRQLRQREWEVSVVATKQGDMRWLPQFARYTPDVFILPHFLRLVDYPRFLRYVIQSRQIDAVLISNSELSYLLLPYLRAYCPHVAFLDYCHMEEEYWKSGGYPRMAVEYQELLDLNVVSSAHLKAWMVARGAQPDRIQVCFTNIDSQQWCPDPERRDAVRRELGVDEGTPAVLYVGRMCAQKQPRVFVETMAQLRQRAVSFVALVAGDGPDLDWLDRAVKKRGLSPWVRLLGAVSNERIRALMNAADVFFLPSLWEGIALSMYEAMACGLPVVGADVGGQRELVTPECGILIPRSDEMTEAARYAEVLATLLRNPQQRQQMGQAGRRRVEAHFRLEQMGDRMAVLLQESLTLRATQPRFIPSLGVGRICATQAVEYMRLAALADWLWQERQQREGLRPLQELGIAHVRWRALIYFTLRRWLLPYYRAGLERDMRWLLPLKNRLKRALLPGGVA